MGSGAVAPFLPGTFDTIPRWATRTEGIPAMERLLLITLITFDLPGANNFRKGFVEVAQRTLSTILGTHHDRVRERLLALEALGLIRIESQGSRKSLKVWINYGSGLNSRPAKPSVLASNDGDALTSKPAFLTSGRGQDWPHSEAVSNSKPKKGRGAEASPPACGCETDCDCAEGVADGKLAVPPAPTASVAKHGIEQQLTPVYLVDRDDVDEILMRAFPGAVTMREETWRELELADPLSR